MSSNFIRRERCPVCDSNDIVTQIKILFQHPVLWSYLSEKYGMESYKKEFDGVSYEVGHCKSCSFYFSRNILSDRFYEVITHIKTPRGLKPDREQGMSIQHYARMAFESERIAVLLKKIPSTISVLEFGSGFGLWLRMATAFNYKTLGVEIYEDRIAYAESFGLKITRSFEELPDASFDFIFSNQVFEHLSNPVGMLRKLTPKLKPGGILQIGVPESKAIRRNIAQFSGVPDKLIQPIGHINCFTNGSLVKMGKESGLTVLPSSFIRMAYLAKIVKELDLKYALPFLLAGYKQKNSCTVYFTK